MMQKSKKILGTIAFTISIVFFGLGMYFPLLSTHKQIIWKFGYEKLTVFKSIKMFFESSEYFLAAIILLFTVLLPLVEYISLFFRIVFDKTSKALQHLDKWNMLDVFLVALLLLNFKINSNIIVMELKIGTTFIALAVIFRILTIILVTNNKINKV